MKDATGAADGSARREVRISKDKLDRDIATLAGRVGAKHWRGVIGVANGGIYPAGRVADQLGLDYREIEIKAYRGRAKATLEVVRSIDDPEQGQGFLVVDDIVDSGDTALAIRKMLPKAAFLSVYAKAEGLSRLETADQPHLCAERFAQNVWIVFPWHQSGWAGEVPQSVALYRAGRGLDNSVPITRQ
jgi:xanthine phosphoribosyltransferase